MIIKRYKPITPSLRQLQRVIEPSLWKGEPIKSLTHGLTKSGGRNNLGRITADHRGGGHKRKYRIIDFKRNNLLEGTIIRLEYDPNRSSHIALVQNEADKSLSYIIAANNLKIGQQIKSGKNSEIEVGHTLFLKNIPIGTMIHNIELYPGKGGQLCRAAGTFASLIQKNESGYGMIRLSSGEQRLISLECSATIGTVSNTDHKNEIIGKAGRTRWLGIRPIVRGVAMNPVDHPHGGGQGKTSGGRPSVTPWGIPTKGYRTRNNKQTDKYIIRRRYQ